MRKWTLSIMVGVSILMVGGCERGGSGLGDDGIVGSEAGSLESEKAVVESGEAEVVVQDTGYEKRIGGQIDGRDGVIFVGGGDGLTGGRVGGSSVVSRDIQLRTEDEKNTVDVFHGAAHETVFVTQNRVVGDFWTNRAMEVPAGSGSGFIWDKSGHVVTNYHVIDGGATITVTLYNQKTYPARVVGGDKKKDIAVLKIEAPSGELVPIRVPGEKYSLAVGQKAIAIGNPYGLDHTLTTGVVSALGRDQPGYGGVTIHDMIQTDASINPGNSGGPLLDSSGQLIGMNTMIYSKSGASAGIGFAVPFTTIKRVVPQIIKTGKVAQIGLGITILPDSVARQHGISGVIIRGVGNETPAGKAGLKGLTTDGQGIYIGDVIVGIGKREVTSYDDLYGALDEHEPGERVEVRVRRDGKIEKVEVELFVLPE